MITPHIVPHLSSSSPRFFEAERASLSSRPECHGLEARRRLFKCPFRQCQVNDREHAQQYDPVAGPGRAGRASPGPVDVDHPATAGAAVTDDGRTIVHSARDHGEVGRLDCITVCRDEAVGPGKASGVPYARR